MNDTFCENKYDYLIVGAGLYGAVFAHEAAEKGKSVLVVEKRPHIGGNVYTEERDGINVHVYGAHIFHTNDERVWNYVNRFARFNNFINSPIANYHGELYHLPFNMNTFHEMWGVTTAEEAEAKIEEQKAEFIAASVNVSDSIQEDGGRVPRNLEEQAISLVGRDIFEKLVKGYTEKQWGRDCKDLPAFIIRRLPVRFTYDNNYFNAGYQGIPIGGYTGMVERMLGLGKEAYAFDNSLPRRGEWDCQGRRMGSPDGTKSFAPKIDVVLNTDYLEHKAELDALADNIVYTGPIDAYFGYGLGALEYRSLRFETEELDIFDFQGNAAVNYTDRETPWTRIIEHKWFEFGKDSKGRDIPQTIITKEYSLTWKAGAEPYYPINDEKNNALYERYLKLYEAENIRLKALGKSIIFGGRLAEYKYYDMDQVIAAALAAAEAI